MKKILPILLIVSSLYCQKKGKNKIIADSVHSDEVKVEKVSEVIISLGDSLKSFETNLFVGEIHNKPELIFLSENRSTITIPTDYAITLKGGNPMISYFYDITLSKGDSLSIYTKPLKINEAVQINHPVFEIQNSSRTWGELNFSYLLYKRNLENQAIEIGPNPGILGVQIDVDKVFNNATDILDSLKSIQSISDTFYQITQFNQKLKLATSRIRNARVTKGFVYLEDLGINLNDKEQLQNPDYINFLREVILYEYFKAQRSVSFSEQFDYVRSNETFLSMEVKMGVLDAYLQSIYLVEKEKFKECMKVFDSINTNPVFKEKWSKVASKMAEEQKRFNETNRNIATLTNLVGSTEVTFEDVLANQKGKIVLVDFWASWCAPCRLEMPFLETIYSKFSKDEFQIIEISIDKDYEAWKRASNIEGLSNEPHNYIISNWEESNLYNNYAIKTIPRYLLFGKKGQIISADAPRPSTTELEKIIRAFL